MTAILKVDTIQDTSGNNIINESSDTITIGASGDTTNIVGTLQNNGAAVGGVMTPAFMGYLSSDQTVTDNTLTKVTINAEEYDTAGNYDHSTNYRFTPTTAGKYFFYGSICLRAASSTSLRAGSIIFYKNGSAIYGGVDDLYDNPTTSSQITATASFEMNGSSDYVELFGKVDVVSGNAKFEADYTNTNHSTYFGAYKIIE